MRLFFISDIHGHFDAMNRLFRTAKIDITQDIIVFGGDLINRGPDSLRMIREIYRLRHIYPQNVMLVSGNHEAALMGLATGQIDQGTYASNFGGGSFLNDISNNNKMSEEEFKRIVVWLSEQPMVAWTDDFVFVHSAIDPTRSLDDQESQTVLWTPHKQFYSHPPHDILNATGKRIVVHGHTPRGQVEFDGARIACDLGAGVLPNSTASLALVDLTNFEYYVTQTDGSTVYKKPIARIGRTEWTTNRR